MRLSAAGLRSGGYARRVDPPDPAADRSPGGIEVHAQRGGAGLAPENTMEAFEGAVALGVDWIELDVQTCGTGELVVIHEPDLRRLAGAEERVAELSLADLQSADVGSHFSAAFAGARVPGLTEVLETFRGRVGIHVEVKEYGVRGDGTAVAAAALIARMGPFDRLLVSSYNVFSLLRIRAAGSRLPLGLVYPPLGGDRGLRRTVRDAAFGKPRLAGRLDVRVLLPQSRVVGEGDVRAAHDAGREVHVWPVNEPEQMRRLAAAGVDGIVTDRPDIALRTLRG